MPVPTAPTLSEIVSEALLQAGESSPSSALTTRAQGAWMEEIKNDIWKRAKRLKTLQVTSHGVLVKGQSRYTYPSDFSSDLEITLLSGGRSGTAQGGGSSSITLASSESAGDNDLIGAEILVTSGTGAGSLSQIISYSSATKVAGVAPAFYTAPAASSGYLIVDKEYPLDQKPIGQFSYFHRTGTGLPSKYFPIGDEDFGEFVLDVAPDTNYGARLRYYANVMAVDTDSALFTTILQQWRTLFTEGIIYKRWKDADDDRAENQYSRYQRELNTLIVRETYGMDLSNLTDRVADFG